MTIYCITCKSNKIKELVEENKVLYFCPDCKLKTGRALIVDSKIRAIRTSRGIKHISVAGIIIDNDKLLLTERRTYPFGLELPVGHVEHGETLEEALRREIYEEVGVKVTSTTMLAHIEHPVSYCRYGSDIEEWVVFLVEGKQGQEFVSNSEVESLSWVPIMRIPVNKLTISTRFVLERLGYIKSKAKKNS